MIVAVANQKGGVGKTTSTACLGGLLAERCRCLLVDLDPQGNLTTASAIQAAGEATMYHVLTEKATAKETIQTPAIGPDILPADINLARAETELLSVVGNFYILKERLETLREFYDCILIDCPPSLGLLTLNGLTAADAVLIPVQCQFFALKGLSALMDTIASVRKRLNSQLSILGVLPTMAERTVMTQDVIHALKTSLEGVRIFPEVVKSIRFSESNLAGQPIHLYAADKPELGYPYQAVRDAILMTSRSEEI